MESVILDCASYCSSRHMNTTLQGHENDFDEVDVLLVKHWFWDTLWDIRPINSLKTLAKKYGNNVKYSFL